MKINKLLPTLLLIAFPFFNILAQEKSIADVISFELKNMGPILNDSEITGYYMFYKTDKLSKSVHSYEIKILDQNLNDLSVKTIEGSKDLYLLDMVYNNKELMLKFFDVKKKKIIFKKFDSKLEEILNEERKIKQVEAITLSYVAKNDEGKNTFLNPIENYGFIDYRIKFEKMKMGYSIDFYPTKMDAEKWSISTDRKSKKNAMASFLYADVDIVLNLILKMKRLTSRNYDYEIQALNAKTGEKMYEKALTDEDYDIIPLSGYKNKSDDNIYIFGNYYPKDKAKLNKPSLGLFAIELDKKGNIINKHFLSWETDVSKFLDVDEKGEIKDVGYLLFLNIVKNSDGNFYIIVEQYNKEMKGLSANIVISDLMVLELNNQFQLQNVRVIDKAKSSYSVPSGTGLNSPQTLSYIARSNGAFGYQFSQSNTDNSVFTVGYVEELKGENKYQFGSITYADSEPVKDIIELTSVKEKNNIKVLPAKAGNVVIVKYNPEEKSLEMNIEKLKY